jgi:DNA-binding MarR family transcriptional regulator
MRAGDHHDRRYRCYEICWMVRDDSIVHRDHGGVRGILQVQVEALSPPNSFLTHYRIQLAHHEPEKETIAQFLRVLNMQEKHNVRTMNSAMQRSIGNAHKSGGPRGATRPSVVYRLLHTAGYLRRFYAAVFDRHGITLTQFNVLCILRAAGLDGLPTLEVAARMFDETPGITRLLDRLEAKNLVRRERSLNNRRQVFCFITEEAQELLETLDPLVKRRAEEAVQMLDDREVDGLLRSLERIRHGSPKKK